ncbi:MAG: hypothetical protein LQ349_005603 [Xanthoria aureola]|nr:MAG: hypothetical protein LQ349_005603 [Xanthoria aureola]
MEPTPPSASASSTSIQSPDGQYRVVRRRNRVPLSCAPCRSRKLKCNRTQPCENCVKRGDAMSCSYAAPGSRKKTSVASPSSNNPGDMQNRIDRLEGLVLSLMTNGAQSAGPAAADRTLSMSASTGSMEYPQNVEVDDLNNHNGMMRPDGEEAESETDQVAQSLGVLKVMDNNKSMYFGEAHWAAILTDITEVKNYFNEHKKQLEEQAQKIQAQKKDDNFPEGLPVLFGGVNPPEFAELLGSLPKRLITDKLYETFWADPHAMGAAWLGQIFAVLCLAMHSYYKMGDEPPEYRGKSLILANKYRSITAQCLMRADILKPVSHTIEALVLHLQGEYARNRDAEVGVWVLVGIIVRLAMRMGYHRDSKLFPGISPFQGEMRRRLWTFVRQADLLFSFQLGLPSMIRLGDCDTALPGNYYDEELYEDMKALPPPRPVTEQTPVSYMIAKASLSFAFGKIVESVHAIATCSYDDVMELDRNLREARAELPPHLRLRPLEDCGDGDGAIIMQRYFLSMLYHKGQCVLHRKFLSRARENNKYAHSRRTCVDSSMELLAHQATLHYESQPGRRLHDVRVQLSSLTSHDFLLAAMIISLDLGQGAEADRQGRDSADLYTWGAERREEMIRALETSIEIWKETRDTSMESYKASEILTVMINKIRTCVQANANGRQAPMTPFPFPSMTNGNTTSPYGPPQMEDKPEHSAAMTLGMLSSGGLTPNASALYNNHGNGYPSNTNMDNLQQNSGLTPNYSMEQAPNGIPSAPSPFSFMTGGQMDMPVNVDWDAWDSYVQNAGLDTGAQLWPAMDLSSGASVGQAMEMPDQQQQQQQQQQNNMFATGANAFAGAPGNMPL